MQRQDKRKNRPKTETKKWQFNGDSSAEPEQRASLLIPLPVVAGRRRNLYTARQSPLGIWAL